MIAEKEKIWVVIESSSHDFYTALNDDTPCRYKNYGESDDFNICLLSELKNKHVASERFYSSEVFHNHSWSSFHLSKKPNEFQLTIKGIIQPAMDKKQFDNKVTEVIRAACYCINGYRCSSIQPLEIIVDYYGEEKDG